MRSLDSALSTAYGYAVQKPAWLVEIAWAASTSRLSGFATVTWSSQTWTVGHVDPRRLSASDLDVSGTLVIGNADDAIAALVLADGIAGRSIKVYGYDAGAVSGGTLAAGVPVLVADCVGSRATIAADEVSIDLRPAAYKLTTPRQRVSAPTFSYLIAAGTRLTINGQTYILNRGA